MNIFTKMLFSYISTLLDWQGFILVK